MKYKDAVTHEGDVTVREEEIAQHLLPLLPGILFAILLKLVLPQSQFVVCATAAI